MPFCGAGENGEARFDCQTCPELVDPELRRRWHCGWMDDSEWTEDFDPPAIGPRDRPIDLEAVRICPGWLVRQQSVMECTQAGLAQEQHCLALHFPRAEAGILEGAMLVTQAFNVFKADLMKRASEK